MATQDDSNALLVRAKAGDPQAFATLFLQHELQIRIIFRSFRRNLPAYDEDELVNEIFLKAWALMPKFEGQKEPQFRKWLRDTSWGICQNLVKQSKRYETDDAIENSTDSSPNPDESYRITVFRECIHKAMGLLSEPLHKVLHLRYIEDFSYEEIAAQLKIPVGTVKSRLYEGHKQLRLRIEELHCRE